MDDLSICIHSTDYDEELPIASIRYTLYNERKVSKVTQVDYWNDDYFDAHIIDAINIGCDVLIFTRLDIDSVKERIYNLLQFTDVLQ